MAAPFCFLDRDGTIMVDRGYLDTPEGVTLLPGAAEGLRQIAALGYRLAIVSNQSGIGRGLFNAEAAQRTMTRLLSLLKAENIIIAAALMCPHIPQEHCACRKPARGLVDQALAQLGGTLEGAVVIGDKSSDMALAEAIGAMGIQIGVDAPDIIAAAALLRQEHAS